MIVRFVVKAELPEPARTVQGIVQQALKINKRSALKLIHDGLVVCRGRTLNQPHLRLKVGDELEIDYAPQPAKVVKKSKTAAKARFEVVHDDDALIVVNKPAGLLTVPTPKREKNTLQSQIRKWLGRHQRNDQAICVHRLDRGVSGLLVFAKTHEVADLIRDQFAARKPYRKYVAILAGNVEQDEGTFRSYLTTDRQTLNRFSTTDTEAGELAITHYRITERWEGVSLAEIRLETGRRNQIRVHFAEAGHPILGDPRYASEQAAHPLWDGGRIALHAESLGFIHPMSREELRFATGWPQIFRDLRRKLRRSRS